MIPHENCIQNHTPVPVVLKSSAHLLITLSAALDYPAPLKPRVCKGTQVVPISKYYVRLPNCYFHRIINDL